MHVDDIDVKDTMIAGLKGLCKFCSKASLNDGLDTDISVLLPKKTTLRKTTVIFSNKV